MRSDRTTKVLLTLIALFLGFLVGKSILSSTPRAVAQATAQAGTSVLQNYNQSMQNNTDGTVLTYHTVPLTSIAISTKDKLRTINVMDQASAFILQFDDRVEVYRVEPVNLTDLAARKAERTANR